MEKPQHVCFVFHTTRVVVLILISDSIRVKFKRVSIYSIKEQQQSQLWPPFKVRFFLCYTYLRTYDVRILSRTSAIFGPSQLLKMECGDPIKCTVAASGNDQIDACLILRNLPSIISLWNIQSHWLFCILIRLGFYDIAKRLKIIPRFSLQNQLT